VIKLGTKSFLAGGTAVVLAAGGAAFAFISSTGTGVDTGRTLEATPEERDMTLSLDDPDQVTDEDVFQDGVTVDVLGTNDSGIPLTITDPNEILPEVSWIEAACPADSFLVSGATASGVSVPAGDSDVVGDFELVFHDLGQAIDQNGCLDVELTFTWESI